MATTATSRLRGLLALVLMLAVVACGDSTGPDDGGEDAEHTFTVENESSHTIDEVNLSPCTDETWGGNDLDGTLAPGESESWGFDSPQCLDIRVITTTDLVASDFGIELDGEFTWTVTD